MASVALVVLLIHVVVVGGFVVAHARSARRSQPAARPPVPGVPGASVAAAPVVPSGRQLEEYVQAGLVDLRIMLVQASRRGHA
jgi:hypothetical protein